MKYAVLLAAVALSACQSPSTDNIADANATAEAPAVQAQPLWLRATDGINVKGAYYKADKPKAIILLFHQAGSSKDEYATIAPRLVAAGYSALAIDQRSGGDMYGKNETVTHLPKGRSATYLDAQKDMEGAIHWAQPVGAPIILWGSSYSAALVFPLASAYTGKIKAVMAFSPDEYFDDKHMIGRSAAWLDVPVFVTSANDPKEIAAAKALAAKVPAGKATVYVPTEGGVHGSSTLIAAKNPKGAEANWTAVMAFLKKVAP